MPEPDPLLVDLELRLLKLERFTRELSDVVAEQQRTIDVLTLDARRVRERLAQGDPAAGDDRPPHY